MDARQLSKDVSPRYELYDFYEEALTKGGQ